MFSFKFRPSEMASEYKVSVPNDFKRLGYTKAYYQKLVSIDCDNNALGHTIVTNKYIMYSYATPIIYVVIHDDTDTNTIRINVVLNEDSYRCSMATIHQLSRFLNELSYKYHLGAGLSYQGLKQEMQSIRMHFFYDSCFWIECFKHGYCRDVCVNLWRYTTTEMETFIASKFATPQVEKLS